MNETLTVAKAAKTASGTMEIGDRGKWVAVPVFRVNGQPLVVRGKWIKIASLHDEDWLEKEIVDPALCISKLKECADAPRADIFYFLQKVPETTPRYSYPMELRSVAVANVAKFNVWWESLPQETRKNVRRSQKRGVVIKVKGLDDEVVNGIVSVQNESPVRQGRHYHHYGKSSDQVKRDYSAFLDRSDFICAYFEDELIGFLKLVYRGNIASILQLNSRAAHYDKRPSNALLAKAVELCEARGISYLTYGLFNYGNKGDSSLREFKVRHGFGEMLVPSYYIPLTLWGKLCLKTKLHRGLIGILPHGVIKAAVGVRTKWYDLVKPKSRCSSMSEQSNSVRQMGRSNPPAGSSS